MTTSDEELGEPPRKFGWVALPVVGTLAAVLVVANTRHDDRRQAAPSPAPTRSTPSPRATEIVLGPPPSLVSAVRGFYPRAELAEMGREVTAAPSPARNYQFMAGQRRITVVVGRFDTRPDVVSRTANSIVVVRTVLGRRLAISVRVSRGRIADRDATVARRLAGDIRLLTPP